MVLNHPEVLPKVEYLDVGVWHNEKVDVKEKENDKPERMPERKFVHRTASCVFQEEGNVEEVLLLFTHAPVVVLGGPRKDDAENGNQE